MIEQLKPVPSRRHTGETPMRGVHHLALTTEDMKATVEFYVGVLGMPLVHAMKVPPGLGSGPGNRGNPPYEDIRHYFFDMGNDALMAFLRNSEGRGAAGPTATPSAACSMSPSPARRRAFRTCWSGWNETVSRTAARSSSCQAWSVSICAIPTA